VKVESVEFVCTAAGARDCPGEDRPEIAVSGRSNVGKSSLLNALFGRRGMAHVSATPGKTQTLNFFLVNGRFHLVDLPGYGFAKAPAQRRNRWSEMMQDYLRHRRQLAGVLQLVDVRHPPSREDREMVGWLVEERMPFLLVATKSDKLAVTKREPAARAIARDLALPDAHPLVASSSETGDGRPAILAWIGRAAAGEFDRP
jgi:GTP-binding protein